MVYADVIGLINENPAAHGAFESATETIRTVYCELKSVNRSEYYLAASAGLSPEIVFVLADYAEYQGERLLMYNAERYRVIRTYRNGTMLEITAGKAAVE